MKYFLTGFLVVASATVSMAQFGYTTNGAQAIGNQTYAPASLGSAAFANSNSFISYAYGMSETAVDNSPAIQAAINALGTNGGTVWLPAGIYAVTNTAFISNSFVTIQGQGSATRSVTFDGFPGVGTSLRFTPQWGAQFPICLAVTTPPIGGRTTGCRVRGINLYSTYMTNTIGMSIYDTDDFKFEDCSVENFDIAVNMNECDTTKLFSCWLNSDGCGVMMASSVNNFCEVTDCNVADIFDTYNSANLGYGFYIASGNMQCQIDGGVLCRCLNGCVYVPPGHRGASISHVKFEADLANSAINAIIAGGTPFGYMLNLNGSGSTYTGCTFLLNSAMTTSQFQGWVTNTEATNGANVGNTYNSQGAVQWSTPPSVLPTGVLTLLSNSLAPATITVGGSPFTYRNTSGHNQFVCLSGSGGVSAVTLNGGALPLALATNAWHPLETNETLTVTYTTAPTMLSKPQ